jgi:hypothetical protein
MGTKLVRVNQDATVDTLGDVGGSGAVSLDYGFDRLAHPQRDQPLLLERVHAHQVTDVDLGPVLDMIWIEGFFMTTDGDLVIVTELSDPTSISRSNTARRSRTRTR